MPLFYYKCSICKKPGRRICSPEEAEEHPPLCCGVPMVRAPQGPTARVVETLDNGVMTKKLERLADAERLFHERAQATEKERKGGQ